MSDESRKIGRYRIEERLGSGGMGDVYLGWDETLERKVALKCINAENRLDDEAKGRFLREAKVLSQLGHPDICRIYDYVEAEDADYLVLELINGKKLRDSIEEGRLGKKQKLEIIKKIASVLEIAHEKGIIHRDLKPDNIIVTEEGGIKVLDFGLARQILIDDQPAQEERPNVPVVPKNRSTDLTLALGGSGGSDVKSTTGLTTVGVVMGTLGYMSPEQARGEDVTSFSDMYSFGIIVEEIFSGKTSYNLESSFNVLLEKNQKGEREELRLEEPDISTLVDDLTAFEPNARLTAREAARRIEEIIGKPAKKRKRVLVASAITLLSAFAVIATLFWIKAARAEKKALEEAEAAKQVSDFLVGLFEVSDPSEAKGNTVTAREVLEKGSEKIESELCSQPKIQSRLMMTMGEVFMNLGLYKEARPLIEKSLLLREKCFGPGSGEMAEIYNSMGLLEEIQGRYDKAEYHYRRSLDINAKLFGEDSNEAASILNNIAGIYVKKEEFEKALETYNRSLAIRKNLRGETSADIGFTYNNLGSLMSKQGKFSEAEKHYHQAYAVWKEKFGDLDPNVAKCLNNLALVCKKQKKFKEAAGYYNQSLKIKEKILGSDHPETASTLNNIASLYYSEQKFEEAEEGWLKVYDIYSRKFGPDHPNLGLISNNLALVYKAKKDFPKALEYYSKALAITEKANGRDSIDVAKILNNISSLQSAQGRFREAENTLTSAIAVVEKKLGPVHQTTLQFKTNLFQLYRDEKDYATAEKTLLSVLDEVRSFKGSKPGDIEAIIEMVVDFYESIGEKTKAEKYKTMKGGNKVQPKKD
ncbi:MAG TPA: serine/threonine-protein kinase [Acidobacteriota bacterium]|nr:serine/threonine-protein kinase [Acidobacteriota bacterium]HQO19020.1 serine/threonine-protein kinase [Acidobacteriota bacterium]HQQ45913.1 serine/threonine-protein kinase [Acidobacteriota bacterium]